eukprot:jgi/Botrbrau1/12476/Bobra.0169s0023.1
MNAFSARPRPLHCPVWGEMARRFKSGVRLLGFGYLFSPVSPFLRGMTRQRSRCPNLQVRDYLISCQWLQLFVGPTICGTNCLWDQLFVGPAVCGNDYL